MRTRGALRRQALVLFVAIVLIYNSNGREIPSVDSQPTKFAAREFALHGRLTLDAVVEATPGYASRPAFQIDRQGHYRSAYSIVPSIEAGMLGALLQAVHVVDVRAPLAPDLIATLTASLLVACAVALVFLALARLGSRREALLAAVGLGLGTNMWALASRTLWQHETVVFGFALALWAWLRPGREVSRLVLCVGAAGLALAGMARPQVTPAIVILIAGYARHVGFRRVLLPAGLVLVAASALMAAQYHWFGSVLGAVPRLEAVHPATHGVPGAISFTPWTGALGLLISPSRGLLVFSPIVFIAFIGVARGLRGGCAPVERVWAGAAVAQIACYCFYAVWWAGHTFGPRYLLDVLVLLMPAAASGVRWMCASSWRRASAAAMLTWSVLAAGIGAFCYPHELWNSSPVDVDTHHERLWDWRDSQIARCVHEGLDPRDFMLFSRDAVRAASK